MQKWYVVQVYTGKEEAAKSLIEQVVSDGVVHECFIPRYQINKKFKGQWVTRTYVLFPGYLIVVADQVEQLTQELCKVPAFTKLLYNNEIFTSLTRDEIAFINAFTKKYHRVIGVSTAVKEGDRVIVKDGPLINQAIKIISVNRRRQTAIVSIRMFGRDIETKVGLSIVC